MGFNHRDEHSTHEIYWDDLVKAVPGEVCQRTGAVYNQDRKGYLLPVINQRYLVLPEERRIYCMRGRSLRGRRSARLFLFDGSSLPVERPRRGARPHLGE